MARPREFDRKEALVKAVDVFWTHGYEATSMTDLQKALGIGRQSLYATFGDKTKIFEEVMAHYVADTEAMLDGRFGPDAGLEDIHAHLRGVAEGITQPENRRGCLIMNTCIERASHDPMAADFVQRGLGAIRRAFVRALTNARASGALREDIDIEAAADSLVCQNAGLALVGRTGLPAEGLIRSVDAAIDALRAAPAT